MNKITATRIVRYRWYCPICGNYNQHNDCTMNECKHCGERFEFNIIEENEE